MVDYKIIQGDCLDILKKHQIKEAVEEVLALNKKVRYVGSSDTQSFGLTKATGNYLILRPEDIEQFLPKNNI